MTDERLKMLIEKRDKPFYDSCFSAKPCDVIVTGLGSSSIAHCDKHGHKFMFVDSESN